MSAPVDYERALNYAVRYIGYTPCTQKRLRDKMKEKEFSPESIVAVVQLLTEKRYLDDVTFAQNYITSKTRYKNYGRRRIVVGLMQKGVSKEDILVAYNALLEQNDGENTDEVEAARRAMSKRVAKKDGDDRQKLMAYLMRRGFSYNIVKKVMDSNDEG